LHPDRIEFQVNRTRNQPSVDPDRNAFCIWDEELNTLSSITTAHLLKAMSQVFSETEKYSESERWSRSDNSGISGKGAAPGAVTRLSTH
jgi:hypothetical protein